MADKMTPKQALFIAEFLVDGNATRAAIASGFSAKSAAQAGARMLNMSHIAAAIQYRQAQRAVKLEITADRVLQELAKLAYFDPGKLYDSDGNRIPVHRLDDVTRAAVASVEDETTDGPGWVRTVKQKIRMADKSKNLELLGKYLKLFTERVEHDGHVTLEQLVSGHCSGADQSPESPE
jgi:phage terminase small subunit